MNPALSSISWSICRKGWVKYHKAIFCRLIIAVSIFQIITIPAYSQTQDSEGKAIVSVQVENNRAISTEIVLSKIKTKAGDKFNQDVANDDLKRLYGTEYFTDVSIDLKDEAGGVVVTFLVEEKPVISDIAFTGNAAFRSGKLQSSMKSKPNDMLNMALLAQDMSEIRALYTKKGYPMVDVKYSIDLDRENNKAKIAITIDEKTQVKVRKITITGSKAIKTGNIVKVLSTKPAWLFNPGVYKEDVLQEDMDRIKSLYDDIGYLDTAVAPKLEYSADGTLLYITVEVAEGKQYLVGDITIKGNIVFTEKILRSKMAMKPGKPFSSKALRIDLVAVRQYYYQYGYMNVIVDVERDLNQATGNIDVIYNIDAKEPVYVGKVEIRGNTKTRDIIVRRELRIYPGERFDGDKIRRSKERLYNLGFFENVSFDTEPTGTPDIQNLVVNVKETKTGEFSFGGGYSSIDLLVGFVEVTQRNFDIIAFPTFTGGGQNLSLRAELGFVRTNFNIGWTDPWIFGFPYSFGFDIYRMTHNKTGDIGWGYDETRTGGDLRLGKEFTDNFRGDLTYRLEEVKIDNVDDAATGDLKKEVGSNWISSMGLALSYDTRDNVFNPTRGYQVSGSIEEAGGIFTGDKDFVRATAYAAFYHTFFEKIVLELKARAGWENPYGKTDDVPIYERFYAGGANTIRGYKERRVGPRDPSTNDPLGGEAMLIGNIEITFPIYERLIKGAVFYDAGNVWKKNKDFIVGGNYKAGTGVGVRVKTPLGPVKVDMGYPLVENADDKKQLEFYFSMSRGF